MRKAALHNLGCKVNSYETEAMQQMLEEAGYEIVPFREGADVYVINTCSVTNIADRKSRQMLHKAKKMNPSAVVVATGCYVQAVGEELQKDAAIDLVIGNNKKKDLISILEQYVEESRNTPEDYIIDISQTPHYEPLSIRRIEGHTRAFIKIQDGCNQFCSYCIIPYTRGRARSRGVAEILEEVETLVQKGCCEIVLTGIHLTSYGIDFAESEKENLLGLIETLDQIPGLKRIRLGSLEPRVITEDFVRTLAGISSICPHFHLSLQSGCDATLARMNRHYTTEDYAARCDLLRRYFANPAITTDVIVGFPGETEEEFAATCDFLEKIHFYEMHVFKYSKRAGTKAAEMKGQIPEPVKTIRSERLLKLTKEMSKEYRKSFLGLSEEVLLEECVTVDGVSYWAGYTKEYVKTAIPYADGLGGTLISGVMERMLSEEIVCLSQKR
ncbi:MAG: tRNA (N(6)-L-threonylcarbamoyladenosine(37)-C(2))-methylthiotransferase MtaB [Hungatella sp.]